MRFIEFARIHHWEEILENACFQLENSCEHFVNHVKNGSEDKKTWHFQCVIQTANKGNHYVFLHLQTLIFQENSCFQPLTPVNALLYIRKMPMNKRKTSFCGVLTKQLTLENDLFTCVHSEGKLPYNETNTGIHRCENAQKTLDFPYAKHE